MTNKQFIITQETKQEITAILAKYNFLGRVILYSKPIDTRIRLAYDLRQTTGGFEQGRLMNEEIRKAFGGFNKVDLTIIKNGDVETLRSTHPVLYLQVIKGEVIYG